MSTVTNRHKRLYNSDLAPTPKEKKNWGSFEILTFGQTMSKVYSDTL